MAKIRVNCPDCGHRFTVHPNGQKIKTLGVRAKRITGNQFEYTITVPEGVETGHTSSVIDDLVLSAALSLPVGAFFGFVASLSAPDYALQIIGIGASAGTALTWGWLCAEHNQRLKRVLPWFLEQRDNWVTAEASLPDKQGVNLTVDHRYRDGKTEAGRTTKRFGPLPVDVARFNEWAQGAIVGKSLGVSHWVPESKMFKRPEYDLLLAKMRDGGIVVDLGSNKGNTLTAAGRRALTRHLNDCGIRPPSPAEEDFLGERLAQAQANNGGNTPLPRSEVCAGGENGA